MTPVDLTFIAVCAGVLAGLLLIVRRSRSITLTVTLTATVGVVVMTVGIAFRARSMFLSAHDLDALTPLLIIGAVAAIAIGLSAALPVALSLRRLRAAADQIGRGERPPPVAFRRRDELGAVSDAFDSMVARLEAMEQQRSLMLSSISHDLRTPLAVIRASVESVRDGVAEDPDRSLLAIDRSVTALDSLVGDLFLYARLTAGGLPTRADRIDAAEIVEEAVELMRPVAAMKGVELRADVDGPATMLGDGQHLGRLLRNLLANSVQHVEAGRGLVVAEVRATDRRVLISVRDNGPGFTSDFAPLAFEPFTRADPARHRATGTAGLGLAIAREIVGRHGGTIGIGTGPGGRLDVCLPMSR